MPTGKATVAEAIRNECLVTLPELLAYFRISRSTFYRWHANKWAAYGHRVGLQWRFTTADVVAMRADAAPAA